MKEPQKRETPDLESEIFTEHDGETPAPTYIAKRVNVTKSPKMAMLEELTLSLKTNSPNQKIEYRESERQAITDFIVNSIRAKNKESQSNNCMIIFGQPGLGKTVLLNEIAQSAKSKARDSLFADSLKRAGEEVSLLGVKRWKIHFYNSMSFQTAAHLLREIGSTVFGLKYNENDNNADYALKRIKEEMSVLLESYYLIVMIDELEYLLYNDKRDFSTVIDFLNMKNPGFVKFGISNTLNIISHVSGVTQTLNYDFLVFKPYTKDKLKGILMSRIDKILERFGVGLKSFISDAVIDYVVKHAVNNNSSDVRALLALCGSVLEGKIQTLVKLIRQDKETEGCNIEITIPDVVDHLLKNALKKQIEVVTRLGVHSQLLLMALCVAMKDNGQVVKLTEVERQYNRLFQLYDLDIEDNMMSQIDTLKSYNMVNVDPKSQDTIRVMLTKAELDRCLKQIEMFESYDKKLNGEEDEKKSVEDTEEEDENNSDEANEDVADIVKD